MIFNIIKKKKNYNNLFYLISLCIKKKSEKLRFADSKGKKAIILKTKNPILDAPLDEI